MITSFAALGEMEKSAAGRNWFQRNFADPVWNAGTAVARDVGDSVNRNVVQPAAQAGANAINQAGQTIQDNVVNPAWNAGVGAINAAQQGLHQAGRDFYNKGIAPAVQGAQAVGGAINQGVQAAGNAVNQGVDNFKTGLGVIGQGAQQLGQAGIQGAQAVGGAINQGVDAAQQGMQQLGQNFQTGLGVIGQGAQQVGSNLREAAGTGLNVAGDLAHSGMNAMGQIGNAAVQAAPWAAAPALGPMGPFLAAGMGPGSARLGGSVQGAYEDAGNMAHDGATALGNMVLPSGAAESIPALSGLGGPPRANIVPEGEFNPGPMPEGYVLARDGGVNGMAPPAPAPVQGPSNEYLQRVMGSYDPNSAFDQRKADAIRQIWQDQGGQVSPNAIYADPRYAQIKSAFALLDPGYMEKTAFLKGIGEGISGVWDRTVKPMWNAGKKVVGGAGDVVGGLGKAVWTGASALPKAGIGAIKGAWTGQGQPGLQGIVGGAFSGATNSLKGSLGDQWNNWKQIGGGVGDMVTGNLENMGRTIAAPYTSAYGFLAGPRQQSSTPSRGTTPDSPASQPKSNPTPYSPQNYYLPPAADFNSLTSGHAKPNATTSSSNNLVTAGGKEKVAKEIQIDEVLPPFASLGDLELEKEAFPRLLRGAGSLLNKWRGASRSKAYRGVMNEFGGADEMARMSLPDKNAIRSLGREALQGVGARRGALAGRMGRAADYLDATPWARNALNYGSGGLLAGGGLYGANRMGYHSGQREGMGQGFTHGMNAGVNAMASQMPGQQGIMDRILNVFRGAPTGPDAATVRNMLEANKEAIISQILEGPRTRNA